VLEVASIVMIDGSAVVMVGLVPLWWSDLMI
jgi:hypothetical protein